MNNQRQAYILALLTVFFWSTMGSAFKLTLQHLDYVSLVFFSSCASLIFLLVLTSARSGWKALRQARGRDWAAAALLGLLNPFAYYLVLFKAYSLIPAQQAVALNYTWPLVLVVLSAPLLGQKISRTSLLAILISFFGAIVVVSQGNIHFLAVNNPLGSLLALGSSVIWALYWIFNLKDRRPVEVKLLMNFFFGCFYAAILLFFTGNTASLNLEGLGGAAYIGLLEMGLSFFLWLKALQLARNTASITKLIYLSPFLSLLFINQLVGEKIGLATLAGLLLIIGGIVWEEVAGRRNKSIL